tara:strand:- start:1186 stop:1695 length:510 start_codon:yes stop_codon:yes gene_type:complete
MFSFWTGRRYSNKIADYLGVNKALFNSALLEAGVTWYTLKVMKRDGVTVHAAAEVLLPALKSGLAQVDLRFGPQVMIDEAKVKISEFEALLVAPTTVSQSGLSYSLKFFVEDDFQTVRGKPLLRQVGETIVDENLDALTLLATPPHHMKNVFICQITNNKTNEVVFSSD